MEPIDPERRSHLDDLVRRGTAAPVRDFRPLWQEYYPRIRAFLARRIPSPQEADDLAQETFLRIFRASRPFSRSEEFEAWLFEIAWNVLRNDHRYRSAAKRQGQDEPLDLLDRIPRMVAAIARQGSPGLDDPLGQCLDREGLELVAKELLAMPDKMRRCAQLRFFHDLSYHEIAGVVGITVEAVKGHLYQAKLRLRERLGDYFSGPPEDEP
jgi:RNA polymerase sigma-70 factor (ECF subfamily)